MCLFAFLGGRHDLRAWGRALFAAGCRLPEKPDATRYARATDQLIRNDCRIIASCASTLQKTKSEAVRSKQNMILYSRLAHLDRLAPYADREQKRCIRAARAAAKKARKKRR